MLHPTPEEIRRFPLFEQVSDADAADASRAMSVRSLSSGEVLMKEGEPGDSAYLLVSGELTVETARPGDDVPVLGPGRLAGEMGLLMNAPRGATVVARGSAETWCVTRSAFEAACERRESWIILFLHEAARILASRLVGLEQELTRVLTTPASPATRQAELEQLRHRLMTQWTF